MPTGHVLTHQLHPSSTQQRPSRERPRNIVSAKPSICWLNKYVFKMASCCCNQPLTNTSLCNNTLLNNLRQDDQRKRQTNYTLQVTVGPRQQWVVTALQHKPWCDGNKLTNRTEKQRVCFIFCLIKWTVVNAKQENFLVTNFNESTEQL